MSIHMKEHAFRGAVLIMVFFSYFAWRLNMTGFNLITSSFTLIAAVALILTIKKFCRKPKDNEKRHQNRMIFTMILVLFLAAVLIRILFLS